MNFAHFIASLSSCNSSRPYLLLLPLYLYRMLLEKIKSKVQKIEGSRFHGFGRREGQWTDWKETWGSWIVQLLAQILCVIIQAQPQVMTKGFTCQALQGRWSFPHQICFMASALWSMRAAVVKNSSAPGQPCPYTPDILAQLPAFGGPFTWGLPQVTLKRLPYRVGRGRGARLEDALLWQDTRCFSTSNNSLLPLPSSRVCKTAGHF